MKTLSLIYGIAALATSLTLTNPDGTPYTGPAPADKPFTVTFGDAVSDNAARPTFTVTTTVSGIDLTSIGLDSNSWQTQAPTAESAQDLAEAVLSSLFDGANITQYLRYPAGVSSLMTKAQFKAKYPGDDPCASPLAAPTGLVLQPGSNSVRLDWSPVDGAAFYHVYRSTASGTLGDLIGYPTGSYGNADTAVTNGTTYYYTVAGVKANLCEGAPSSQVSATPSASGGGGAPLD